MSKVKSENPAAYNTQAAPETTQDDETIRKAINILAMRIAQPGACIDSPTITRQFLALQLAEEPAEVFCCIFLDNRHRVIEFQRLFTGTIDGCSVHPREVVRACIQHNAAAVILAHNHPSGMAEPSRADTQLTRRLVDALGLLDIRILDHIIIGGANEYTSFAERGLI